MISVKQQYFRPINFNVLIESIFDMQIVNSILLTLENRFLDYLEIKRKKHFDHYFGCARISGFRELLFVFLTFFVFYLRYALRMA